MNEGSGEHIEAVRQIEAVWEQIESLCEDCGGRLGPSVLVAQEVALLRSRIEEARAEGDALRLQRCLAATKLLHARFKLLSRLGAPVCPI